MTQTDKEFNFVVNGNAVNLTYETLDSGTKKVSYSIDYADGDETYDYFMVNKDSQQNIVDLEGNLLEALFSDLSFNANIKTKEQVKEYINETYLYDDLYTKTVRIQNMAELMGIKG